ncbi:MAG: hypothetical protein R2780_08810 [Crocinitomicaceae bacterium]|nr:hypothetical protein [Crocinitomicaceae bacterium]
MRHQKSGGNFIILYYELTNGKVYAGQDGPGPSGGGAHVCSFEDYLCESVNSEEVRSYVIREFGTDHHEKILNALRHLIK